MAQCAEWTRLDLEGVQLTVLTEAPAGECAQLVVLTPAEYGSLASNPFQLSISEGAQVSAAILGVWATAWCCKALVRALNSDGEKE